MTFPPSTNVFFKEKFGAADRQAHEPHLAEDFLRSYGYQPLTVAVVYEAIARILLARV